MTASKRPTLPIEQLTPELARLLAESPRVVRELTKLTGYSEPAVRIRLEFLESEGHAHRTARGTLHRGKGGYYLWHAGAAPSVVTVVKPIPVSKLSQKTVTEYPPNHRRDDLVEALFGPGRKEAP